MNLAVVASAQGDRELVTHLAAERPDLGEAQMVRIARLPAANEAGVPGDVSHMIAVTKPTRFW